MVDASPSLIFSRTVTDQVFANLRSFGEYAS